MSRWIRQRKRDQYYRLAKAKGYRSRAAFKLLQAVRKYRFIRPGNVVVDLGAAPGGWTQVAREIVGSLGYVLAVDRKSIVPFPESNVRTLVADIEDPAVAQAISEALPRTPDVVICDVSPNVSGAWEVDQARQIHLARSVARIGVQLLRPGGSFFTKAFQGDELKDFVDELRLQFRVARIVKPPASKPQSSEVYLLAMGLVKGSSAC